MARILILLMALNALFPVGGFASICATDMSKHPTTTMQNSGENISHSQHKNISPSSQSHCDQPGMSCHMDSTKSSLMQSMDCDANCCNSCMGTSVVLTSLSHFSVAHPLSLKPVSGYTNFYRHTTQPELPPPLV